MNTMKRMGALCLALVLVALLAVPASAVLVMSNRSTRLVDMQVLHAVEAGTVESITDSYGNEHSGNIYQFDARRKGYLTLELKGQYESFDGSLLASTGTASGASMYFSVFADGVEVFSVSAYTRQMDAVPIHLDLTGVNVLEFKSMEPNETRDSWLYLTEGLFLQKDGDPAEYREWVSLKDLVLIDSGSYSSSDRLIWDAYGELYFDHYFLDGSYSGYAMYNLNREYDTFSCWLFPQRGANDNANIMVFFHVDGQEVAGFQLMKLNEAVFVELDVRNAKTLKVVTVVMENLRDQGVYMGSTKLTRHVHVPGEWVEDVTPTCTTEGQRSTSCTVCGAAMEAETLPALGHVGNETWEVTREPTCTEAGQRIQMCVNCPDIALTEEIPATGHTPGDAWEITTEATCVAKGEQVKRCNLCGEVAQSAPIAKKPHTADDAWEVIREATCPTEGRKDQMSVDCGTVVNSEPIAVTAHPYGEWYTVSGSAWNPPVVKERVCDTCGNAERSEDNSTAWLKPTVIVLLLAVLGGCGGVGYLLYSKRLPLHPSSIPLLLKKESGEVDDMAGSSDAAEMPDDVMTPNE